MKKPLVVGNWKMNLVSSEAAVLARGIADFVRTLSEIRVVLAPSFTLRSEVRNALSDSNTVLNLKYLKNILYQAKNIHNSRLEIIKKYGTQNVK